MKSLTQRGNFFTSNSQAPFQILNLLPKVDPTIYNKYNKTHGNYKLQWHPDK